MKVYENEIISWEPLAIRISGGKGVGAQSLARLDRFVRTWLECRKQKGICHCELSEFDCRPEIHAKQLKVTCEWMCRVCVQALANDLGKGFRSIERFEIGISPDATKWSDPLRIQFCDIPAKRVRLEFGSVVNVCSFRLSSHPITVAQFADFTKKSGYKTYAETIDREDTYLSNPVVSQLGKRFGQCLPALYLCWKDISEFCSFTGFRLPTEAEWLAAAVWDFKDRISTEVYWKRMKERAESKPLCQPVKGLELFDGWEFTASEEDDKIVVRSGPRYWLTFNWKRPEIIKRHRRLVSSDYREIHTVFRVVAEPKQ